MFKSFFRRAPFSDGELIPPGAGHPSAGWELILPATGRRARGVAKRLRSRARLRRLRVLLATPRPEPNEAHGAFHRAFHPKARHPEPNGASSSTRRLSTETARHPGFPHPSGITGGAATRFPIFTCGWSVDNAPAGPLRLRRSCLKQAAGPWLQHAPAVLQRRRQAGRLTLQRGYRWAGRSRHSHCRAAFLSLSHHPAVSQELHPGRTASCSNPHLV